MPYRYILFLILSFLSVISCKKSSESANSGFADFIGISSNTGTYDSTITIYAKNFSNHDTIELNGVPCSVVSIQGQDIVITIPKGAGTGPFTITDGTTTVTGPIFYFKYTSYVTTIAGSQDDGSIDGTGLSATFIFLDDMVMDPAGILFTTEYSDSSRVREVNSAGVVTTFAGNGQRGSIDGSPNVAEFEQLTGISIDASHNLYVSDYFNQKIRKIAPDGSVTTFAGNGSVGLVDGPAVSASFNGPTGIAVDSAGNVYVADNGNNAVRRISADGNVTTLTNNGFIALSNSNAPHSTFSFPWALCLDHHGNLLLGDRGYIWKITLNGSLSVFAGIGTPGFADGPANNAQFEQVEGLVVDEHYNVYASDANNFIIRQINPYGTVSTFAGNRNEGPGYGFTDIDGPWQTATFSSPQGLTIDKQGNLYVSDGYRVREIIVQ
jgi:hypothetical protein